MDKTQPSYTTFVGFDVSKETVTAYHSQTGQTVDIDNTPAAIGRYLKALDRQQKPGSSQPSSPGARN